MKKKIINGILVTAMLFAASTSFVSCKDNVDDEIANVYVDMNALQGKIDDLNGKLNTLEGAVSQNTQEIANLKAQLATLQSQLDDLKGQVNANTQAIEQLKADLATLEEKVDGLFDLINNLVVGVTVRQTVDPVIGSINLPGYNPLFLATYVGENGSKIKEFPWAGDDYNADEDGDVLDEAEINEDLVISMVLSSEEADDEEEEADENLIMDTENNAGTLYFSLNPINVDATKLTFDLVNSVGAVSPVEISNVQQSAHVITPSAGKHEGAADADEATPYLYSAEANIPKDFSKDLAWNKEVPTVDMMENLGNDISHIIAEVKKGWSTSSLIGDITGRIQNFYQNWYKNLTARQYQNLRVSYTDANGNERVITSPDNIVTATVTPFSFADMQTIDLALGNSKTHISRALLEATAGKLVEKVMEKLDKYAAKANGFEIKGFETLPNGSYIIIVAAEDGSEVEVTVDNDGNIKVEGNNVGVADTDLAAILNALSENIDMANDLIKRAQAKYQAVKTNTDSYIERAARFLENIATKLITTYGANIATEAVRPILLLDTNEGIQYLAYGNTIETTDGTAKLLVTSVTNEAIVPVFKKYVAVMQDGKLVDSKLLNCDEKVAEVELPKGSCEIVYSVVDYSGYTMTNRCLVNVKEKEAEKK